MKIEYLEKCLNLLKETLQINMNNDTIQMEIVSIYSILCDVVKDTEKCIELLNNSLIFIKPNNWLNWSLLIPPIPVFSSSVSLVSVPVIP